MTELSKEGTERFELLVGLKLNDVRAKLQGAQDTAASRQYDLTEEWCDELIDDLTEVRRLARQLGNLNEEDA